MQSHLIIHGVDYTPYIVQGSYEIGTNDVYESWEDGNMVEHRVIVTRKVNGSVQILCSDMPRCKKASDFIADLDAATDNGVLTLGVYVPNLGSFKAINCYYSLKNAQHVKSIGGVFTDVFTLQIKER